MSDSLRPHESQYTRPPCPSPTHRVHSNSCALSRWCHPAISSSVVPFSSCPQSLQHQSLFQWVNSLHEVDKVLEFQLQHQSFQWAQTVEGQRFLLKDGLPWFTHFYIYMYNSRMFNLEPLRTKWPFVHLSNTESAATMSKDAIKTRDHLKLSWNF